MCGIVGYVSTQGTDSLNANDQAKRDYSAIDVVMGGLKRMEYRGYDSAGVALATPGEPLFCEKKSGKLSNLKAALDAEDVPVATTGIGHTRWATHGAPTDQNAHPHLADNGKLALIHNGIIENFTTLKERLLKDGVEFVSDTDTEVAAHLLAKNYRSSGNLTEAMRVTVNQLEGAFTLLAIHQDLPNTVVAARRNSPLVIGLGDGENFLGSDVAAFIDYTRRAVEIGQDQIVTITPHSVDIIDFDGNRAEGEPYTVDWDPATAEKGGFESFMDKEIHDQPQAVADTLLGRMDQNGNLKLSEMNIDESVLKSIDKIVVVACGTAAYAGQVARYAIEHWCRIPTEVELAHEFRYRDPVVTEKTLVVAVSQSGETMDTLMAVRHAREQGAKVIAICNTYGSTIPRESDGVLYTHAGPEIAVASTKSFIAQIVACYLLGLYLAQLRGNKYQDEIMVILDELDQIPGKIERLLETRKGEVSELANSMKETTSVLFLGRHVGFPVALEGALKLKELAYIHAEGFAAGELKHGPIALIEEGQPVFIVVPSRSSRYSLHDKVISNIQEVRARGANTIVIAEEGDTAVEQFASKVIYVPTTPTLLAPLLTTIPLQIFAMELASAKGLNVDQPRNLAKSVTVE